MNTESERKKRYFEELAIALRREGFTAEHIEGGGMAVGFDGRHLCKFREAGSITYRKEDVATLEGAAAKDKVYEIVLVTAEYMKQMEQAPPLQAIGLQNSYKLLADFNGTVLAGMYSEYGVQFVTWEWNFNREGLYHGYYCGNNYEGAKRNFAIRSGLIPRQQLFSKERLIEIYRCCADALEAGFDLTYEREKRIQGVLEQIENGMPDIMDCIREQERHTMEPYSEGQTM